MKKLRKGSLAYNIIKQLKTEGWFYRRQATKIAIKLDVFKYGFVSTDTKRELDRLCERGLLKSKVVKRGWNFGRSSKIPVLCMYAVTQEGIKALEEIKN